jgi:CHAT domain-containing protein
VEGLNRQQSVSRYSVETGLIYSRLKDFDAAIACIRRGMEIARRQGQSPTGLDMLNYARLRLAQVYREMGKYTEALNELDQASEFYRSSGWETQSYLIAKEVLLNQLAIGDISSGRRQLDLVLGLLEKHRTKILQQSNRNSFFDSEQNVYDIAVDFAYTSLGRPELAFNYSELSRARSLLDSATVARQITTEFNLPEESLSDSTRPLTLAELQPRIPREVQILQYAVLEDRTIAWVITGDNIVSRAIKHDQGDLKDKIKAYLDQISNSREIERDWRRTSDDLYKILISPVEPLLDKQRLLCIVPDKILNFLPFGSLRSPQTERHLIEDYALLTAPSSTLFIRGAKNAERKARTNRERLLSVGNPAFNPAVFKLPDLASAASEAEAIAPLYDESVSLVGKNAKKTSLLGEIEGADVVHLAMHYLPDHRSPMLSKLILADAGAGAEEENTLSMFEVYKLKLTKARLVVLSACRTRAEEYYNGEGVIGLSRPFEAAGVPLVISSLWPVDSDETEKLMINFHTLRRKKGLPTVNALREAQIAMLHGRDERLRHPYYWAAFVASGGYSRF